jgi:hypothetical protein
MGPAVSGGGPVHQLLQVRRHEGADGGWQEPDVKVDAV